MYQKFIWVFPARTNYQAVNKGSCRTTVANNGIGFSKAVRKIKAARLIMYLPFASVARGIRLSNYAGGTMHQAVEGNVRIPTGLPEYGKDFCRTLTYSY